MYTLEALEEEYKLVHTITFHSQGILYLIATELTVVGLSTCSMKLCLHLVSTPCICLHAHNAAEMEGGAMYALGANITFQGRSIPTFNSNSVQNGGAMFNSATLTLNEKVIVNTLHNNMEE